MPRAGSRTGRPGLRRHRVPAAERHEDLRCVLPAAHNGRADDQERRNRSVQYIAHPDWRWFRLGKETPAKYESYVDLAPGAWTKVKIEVRGAGARLLVHGQEQPTLVVNDVKSGAQARGAVALWIGPGTIAHFRNLRVGPLP